MATEGKRIYEFTDEQAAYSPDIYLVTDDSSFASGAKKVKIGTIYPKTNTLDAAGSINTATQLLRTDNGSGSESKITVDNLITAVTTNILNIIGLKMKLVANVSSAAVVTKIYGDITAQASLISSGKYRITHNYGSTNYVVLASVTTSTDICVRSITKLANTFEVILGDYETRREQDFQFTMIEINEAS